MILPVRRTVLALACVRAGHKQVWGIACLWFGKMANVLSKPCPGIGSAAFQADLHACSSMTLTRSPSLSLQVRRPIQLAQMLKALNRKSDRQGMHLASERAGPVVVSDSYCPGTCHDVCARVCMCERIARNVTLAIYFWRISWSLYPDENAPALTLPLPFFPPNELFIFARWA